MTWVATNDGSVFSAADDAAQNDNLQGALLACGSLVFDFDFSLGQKAPCKLVDYRADHGWKRRFAIYLNADYSLSVEVRQGSNSSYARLSDINVQEAGGLRLTYAWDAPNNIGILSAENSEGGAIHQADIRDPIPLPASDAYKIVRGHSNIKIDERLQHLALSDQVAPIGPAATISAGAMVQTADGVCAIERLKLGDLVQTKDSGLQPVRWLLKNLRPAIGGSAPLRIRAPFFGLTKDIVVARDQRVLITGVETEYNLGHDAALIEAHGLLGHPAAAAVSRTRSTQYYQVLLDKHECICISGAWTDSLYVGHLKQSPEILRTTGLADIPAGILPIHRSHTHPHLHNYERQALLDTLTA